MKNEILKISGVSFSMSLYFWLSCWGFEGFSANFEHFNEHMPKESPRKSGNDQFGYSSKLNLEVTKNDENDEFSHFRFGTGFEVGELQGSSQGITKLKKRLVEHMS